MRTAILSLSVFATWCAGATVSRAAQMAIELVVVDSGGNPISVATVGQAVELEFFAEDLRDSPLAPGVYASAADITYSEVGLSGSAVYQPGWYAVSATDYSQDGLIQHANAFSLSLSSTGPGPLLMFTIPFLVGGVGTATFTTSPTNVEGYDNLLFGDNSAISADQVDFGTASLTIVPEPAASTLAAMAVLILAARAGWRRRSRPKEASV